MGDKLTVTPASRLTDELRNQLRANKAELVAALTATSEARRVSTEGEPVNARRRCANCRHVLYHGTCGEPVAAGLAERFEICWPPRGHAGKCRAFSAKPGRVPGSLLPRMSDEDMNRCHQPAWNDAEIALFVKRVGLLLRHGAGSDRADALAERLVLRDRDDDDRRMCLECAELAVSGRCLAAGRGEIAGVDGKMEPVVNVLMRCPAFLPALGEDLSLERNHRAS
jgi:hypothetical protein